MTNQLTLTVNGTTPTAPLTIPLFNNQTTITFYENNKLNATLRYNEETGRTNLIMTYDIPCKIHVYISLQSSVSTTDKEHVSCGQPRTIMHIDHYIHKIPIEILLSITPYYKYDGNRYYETTEHFVITTDTSLPVPKTLKEQVKISKTQLTKKTETITNLKRQLTETFSQYNTTMVRLETQLSDLQTRYNTLETNYNDLQTRYNDLESQPRSNPTELNQTKSDLSDLQTRYNTLQSQYNDLQTQHNTLQTKTDDLMDKVNAKSDTKNTWKERHNICFDKKENLKSTVENITTELNQCNESKSTLETQLTQYKLDIVDNENQCTQLLNDHEAQLESYRQQITNHTTTITEKQDEIDQLKQQLLEAENRIRELES